MWRRSFIIFLTVVNSAAIPKASSKRELQRLIRLPRVEFSAPLHFDRTSGFVVFPIESAGAAVVDRMLKEAKGTPADAELYLQAGRIFAREREIVGAIRSYARAADLFGRRLEVEPGSIKALIGSAQSLAALGRFGEAQASLDKARSLAPDDVQVSLAFALFHKEKAWWAFVGEEHRYIQLSFLQTLERLLRRPLTTSRIDSTRTELAAAEEFFNRSGEGMHDNSPYLQERAAFCSFRAALLTALKQAQAGTSDSRELRGSLFVADAIADLGRAAEIENDSPNLLATATFARAMGEVTAKRGGDDALEIWRQLSTDIQHEILLTCRRLEAIAQSGGKAAAEAAEYLGCTQVYLVKDFLGGERSFRNALRMDSARERSWDLLVFSILSGGDSTELVEACEERSSSLPSARSSTLLIKSYQRQGDSTRAELAALLAVGTYPNDLHVNLSLAAMLLKRDDLETVLWRAGEALTRAEKQLGIAASRQSQVDFVLLKSIYFGLSDQPEQAKLLLRPFLKQDGALPEAEEVLGALED